jgi:hypothetical protein
MATPANDVVHVDPPTDEATTSGDRDPPPSIVTGRPPDYAIRRSLRPPVRFTPGADLELWIKWFEMYVRCVGVAKEQWTRELLPLLDDEPFRIIINWDSWSRLTMMP